MTILKVIKQNCFKKLYTRQLSTQPNFGFIFDIDGVILRGQNALPAVPDSFKRLVGSNGTFRVPTVFVTNSGNTLRKEKANELSRLLNIDIHGDQVCLSHSPLKLFNEYHKKRVLVCGQGKIKAIANEIGFENLVTMDELVDNFPSLDCVDKSKRRFTNGPVDKNFKKIDGIVLLNECTRWESALPLIIDLLTTDGMPSRMPTTLPYPHIFLIASNMDLLWVSHAPLPRYGHGAFLHILETLYKKTTCKDIVYTVMTGKPSLVTYFYANGLLEEQARKIGIKHKIDTIYAVGDNINTDVYGANLYNKFLQNQEIDNHVRLPESIQLNNIEDSTAKLCKSILVETGVHKSESEFIEHHSHRDFLPLDKALCTPNIVTKDVNEAIDYVLKNEGLK